MNSTSRGFVLRSLLLIALLIGAVWSGLDWRTAAARARDRRTDLDRCVELAKDIGRLRSRPRLAALYTAESAAAITQRAEDAVEAAHMPVGNLESVEPGSPQPLGASDYLLRPTRIVLNQTSMEQLLRFCRSLTGDTRRLTIRNINLLPAQSADRGTVRWAVDITLTELVYSPTNR